MKGFLYTLAGAIVFFAIGNLLPITDIYSDWVVHSHDDENNLVAIILFVEWPLYILLGGAVGFYASKRQRSRPARGGRGVKVTRI